MDTKDTVLGLRRKWDKLYRKNSRSGRRELDLPVRYSRLGQKKFVVQYDAGSRFFFDSKIDCLSYFRYYKLMFWLDHFGCKSKDSSKASMVRSLRECDHKKELTQFINILDKMLISTEISYRSLNSFKTKMNKFDDFEIIAWGALTEIMNSHANRSDILENSACIKSLPLSAKKKLSYLLKLNKLVRNKAFDGNNLDHYKLALLYFRDWPELAR